MSYTIYTATKKGESPVVVFESKSSANLYDAVQDAIDHDVALHGADLSGLILFGDLHGLQADGALLSGFESRGFGIRDCSFRGAKLSGDWSGSVIKDCDFAVSTIDGDMTLAHIENCSFWGAMVANLDMTASTQLGLTFSGAYTNSSESLKGLLPQTAPDVHKKMMRFDSDVSLRGAPTGPAYYHRLLAQLPIKASDGANVDVCADVEWTATLGEPGALSQEQLAAATLQIRSSAKVATLIAKTCQADSERSITVGALASVGAQFITNDEELRQKLQHLTAQQMKQQYQQIAEKISFLEPLTHTNALSKQTQLKTGAPFGALSYRNAFDENGSVSPAGLIEHIDSGALLYVPLAASSQDKLPGWELGTLSNLMNSGGKGGFDWGNTSGADGGYGKERLQAMIDAGLVQRTGGATPNQLGGTWPEVALTHAGAAVALAYQTQAPALTWVGKPAQKQDQPQTVESRPRMA